MRDSLSGATDLLDDTISAGKHSYDCPEAGEWGVLNFKETPYIGSNGETYSIFTMTNDRYTFPMGKKAVATNPRDCD